MARSGQASRQLEQTTPLRGRQLSATTARAREGTAMAWRSSARGVQALSHSPQKVHSPRRGSNTGWPAAPRTSTCSGQRSMQAPQAVQASRKSDSASAQGGRSGGTACARPSNNARRERSGAIDMSVPGRRTGEHLPDPDHEAIAGDDHHRQQREHDRSEQQEGDPLPALRRWLVWLVHGLLQLAARRGLRPPFAPDTTPGGVMVRLHGSAGAFVRSGGRISTRLCESGRLAYTTSTPRHRHPGARRDPGPRRNRPLTVIPAKAGIHFDFSGLPRLIKAGSRWIPACAGMTARQRQRRWIPAFAGTTESATPTKKPALGPAFLLLRQRETYAACFHWPSAARPLSRARAYTVCCALAKLFDQVLRPQLQRGRLHGATVGERQRPRVRAHLVHRVEVRGGVLVGLAAGQEHDARQRRRHGRLQALQRRGGDFLDAGLLAAGRCPAATIEAFRMVPSSITFCSYSEANSERSVTSVTS